MDIFNTKGRVDFMVYNNVIEGVFISRPNRFIAEVIVGSSLVKCHVKNTGRCKELLIEGASVYLTDHKGEMKKRKLRYSLIGVIKESNGSSRIVNIDSLAPNTLVREALIAGTIKLDGFNQETMKITMEKTYKNSRLDIYIEDDNNRGFIEVKGVTLENNQIGMFPDAPTKRGVKHIKHLIEARNEGYFAFVIFVIQMEGIKAFRPNDQMDGEFGHILREANTKGVIPLAFSCNVNENSLYISRKVDIELYNI